MAKVTLFGLTYPMSSHESRMYLCADCKARLDGVKHGGRWAVLHVTKEGEANCDVCSRVGT